MFQRVLIANRGEIAIRIARTLSAMQIPSVAVAPADDAASLHSRACDQLQILPGRGTAAYLDGAALIVAARAAGADAIHPGYGFLSENAGFAADCAAAGLCFIGPGPDQLRLLGDKGAARALASRLDVPVPAGTSQVTTLSAAAAFMAALPPGQGVMVKALAGGGGRGMRQVKDAADLPEAWASAAAEAKAAFGSGDLYVEALITGARHIEVQILGDKGGSVTHLWDRDCSFQRRHQKLIEFAPAGDLPADLRAGIIDAALKIARASRLQTLCTMEFLVDDSRAGGAFYFLEANPRLQVEHTVTEAVTGYDLVSLQIALAAGQSLGDIGLGVPPAPPKGRAVQLRINLEEIGPDGSLLLAGGTITAWSLPGGPGVRVDSYGYAGYETSPAFDPLIAKLIVSHPTDEPAALLQKARRALSELTIAGVATNAFFLQQALNSPELIAGQLRTDSFPKIAARIRNKGTEAALPRYLTPPEVLPALPPASQQGGQDLPPGCTGLRAPMGGVLVRLLAAPGDRIAKDQVIAVIEAMKMEHPVTAPVTARLRSLAATEGAALRSGDLLAVLETIEDNEALTANAEIAVEDSGQAALAAELLAWRHALSDAGRDKAAAAQAARGQLTARARIAALADSGSFTEIGSLVRNPMLDRPAPADGVVTGACRIDGRPVYIAAQDFTVFGGSAGHVGDAKLIRLTRLARDHGCPLILLLDGGGHRIQDGQNSHAYAAATPVFHELARLSGWVPVVAGVMGFGFAANTNYAGMADYVTMVRGQSTMGLAGPALVRAGTGEVIDAMTLGGAGAQADTHGLADAAFDSEADAFSAIRCFLSYLPPNAGSAAPVACVPAPPMADQSVLSDLVPVNSRRAYDMAAVIEALADQGSVFGWKDSYAKNILTAFARFDGRPCGVIASQPLVRGGMLDARACEKAARFIAICDAFGLPLISLVDIPGMSIGSAAERTQLGRRSARMLFELAHASVPLITIILRKGYGLGYLAMAGGRSFGADAVFAWPSAEICAMSLEGAVDIVHRREIDSAADRQVRRAELVAEMRAHVSARQAAEGFGIDELILPQETRARILDVLSRTAPRKSRDMPQKYRAISPI